MNADPAVMRHYPATLTRAESDAAADRIAAHVAQHGWGPWAVEEKGGAPFIGMVGLLTVGFAERFTPAVEVLWRIATPFQRRGHAEEAARLSLAFGFATLGLAEIVAFTVPCNLPSQRLMEKLGMRPDGVFDHPKLPEGHPLRSHRLFRLARPA